MAYDTEKLMTSLSLLDEDIDESIPKFTNVKHNSLEKSQNVNTSKIAKNNPDNFVRMKKTNTLNTQRKLLDESRSKLEELDELIESMMI